MYNIVKYVENYRTLKVQFFNRIDDICVYATGKKCEIFYITLIGIPLIAIFLFSILYFGFFLLGIMRGHVFPVSEIFYFFPEMTKIFYPEKNILRYCIIYSLCAFGMTWVLAHGKHSIVYQKCIQFLDQYWGLFSFPVILCLIYATIGGVFFSPETNPARCEIAGIVPFSDANGHFSAYSTYLYDGKISDWVLRRPFAAFLGASIQWVSGNNPTTAIMLRCLLIASAMWALAYNINRYHGPWSALLGGALCLYYIAPYLQSFLTEGLGFFWACLAAALWLQAMRSRELFWDMAAFFATCCALLTRMGSMFLIPFLMLYILWKWKENHSQPRWWFKPAMWLCICGIMIVLLNVSFASRGYGHGQTGSNFAYSFAGLSLGQDWAAPGKVYTEKLNGLDEKRQSHFLYKQAIKNIIKDPGMFLHRLWEGEKEFIKHMDFFCPFRSLKYILCFLVIIHLFFFNKLKLFFWIFFFIAVSLSIPFIYFDDSWRVNIAAYPFIAVFLSFSLSTKYIKYSNNTVIDDQTTTASKFSLCLGIFLLSLMVFTAILPKVYLLPDVRKVRQYIESTKDLPPVLGLGNGSAAGFLVIPDNEHPDPRIPSLTYSRFKKLYEESPFKEIFKYDLPKLPFAVLAQPVLERGGYGNYTIAPPELLTEKNVLLWGIENKLFDKLAYVPWDKVIHADPLVVK